MRIIPKKALQDYWEAHPDCREALSAWCAEVKAALWPDLKALKEQYSSVSVLSGERVVFSINENRNLLAVKIDFARQLLFILWVGTQLQYSKINLETITYAAS